jgi:hypothetical protein
MAAPVAIRITGLKETRKALKAAEGQIGDLKAVYQEIGDYVLPLVKQRIPSGSGKLKASYTMKVLQAGPNIRSPLVYAPVNEYGGMVRWAPRQEFQKWTDGSIRRGRVHLIQIKPSMQGSGSYFTYPAIEENMGHIEQIVVKGVDKIWDKSLGG